MIARLAFLISKVQIFMIASASLAVLELMMSLNSMVNYSAHYMFKNLVKANNNPAGFVECQGPRF